MVLCLCTSVSGSDAMPLLRRHSSQKEESKDATEEPHNARPSLFHRLSRRSSHEKVHDNEPVTTKSDDAPEIANTSPIPPQNVARPAVVPSAATPDDNDAPVDGLTKEDVRALFYGAPHFMIEKGRHGKYFPQAFFPWNSDLEISDLQDRRYLSHETFAMTTLHAHLPIPDEMNWKPSPLPTPPEKWKRPMLDLGIFETPNMLGVQGREPGTVGLRFFLELPISERLRTIEKAKEQERGDMGSLSRISANETFREEAERSHTGKHAPRQDRIKLINDGPTAWEYLGIRDVESSTIIDRLSYLSKVHDDVLELGVETTILHKQSCAALYDDLFTKLLYPPTKSTEESLGEHHRTGLKVQIETIVKVLTTPGVWIDFSLVEPRIRLAQGLWQLPPYDYQSSDTTTLRPGAERKWLLLQILLAKELMVRLVGALTLGSSEKFRDFHLTGDEIHHYNKMRNLKIDWDLVMARRFLDTVFVEHSLDVDLQRILQDDQNTQSRLSSVFKKNMDIHAADNDLSIWSCAILPRRADAQFEGLLRFARMIQWPHVDNLEADLTQRYQGISPALHKKLYTQPIFSAHDASVPRRASAVPMRSLFSGDDWVESARVTLKPASGVELGGFLGRSWLSGLIMPGDGGCLSIMACLLEQDSRAAKLGSTAFLHGGFVFEGQRSFWSKFCIVGRVLAPAKGSTECMGWINAPQFSPIDHERKPFTDMWLDVTAAKPPTTRQGLRIYDGQKLADDSNVLGAGRGKVTSSEYGMVTDKVLEDLELMTIEVDDLMLLPKYHSDSQESTLSATLTFMSSSRDMTPALKELQLNYNVVFVSSHPCRPPHGHVSLTAGTLKGHPHHRPEEHLPSHPLHNTYKFEAKSIADLIDAAPPQAGRDQAVWIVDARGSPSKDIFVRAWCSQVGTSAIVSRVGKACLSCSIREAFALEIGIIIRVGESIKV